MEAKENNNILKQTNNDPKFFQKCIFCNILKNKIGIIYSDNLIFAIKDLQQCAKAHYLFLPITHINYINDLQIEELYLIEHLQKKALELGFHSQKVASKYHIHLHAFALPIESKYLDEIQYGLNLTTPDQLIELLKSDRVCELPSKIKIANNKTSMNEVFVELKQKVLGCTFCNIYNSKKKLLYSDDSIFVINDVKTHSSKAHLLFLPIIHIIDVSELTLEHIPLIEKLEKFANEYMQKEYPKQKYRFGFHGPKFISKFHLHMHAFVLPFEIDYYDKLKYGINLIPPKKVIEKIKTIDENYD